MNRERRGRSVGKGCPICGDPADVAYRPFCSRRCADVDLSRWLKGTYAIPVGGSDEDEDGEDTGAAHDISGETRRNTDADE